jgi:hypothetical protein
MPTLAQELESAGMQLAIALLKHYIQNPAAVTEEGEAVHQLAMLATQADKQVNGALWAFKPGQAQSKESK